MPIVKTVRSFKELGEELERFRSILMESAQVQSLAAAHRILEVSQDLCPVETGTLRDSGRIEHGGPGEWLIVFGGAEYINPKTGMPCTYARLVHDGTSRMFPRPFVRWAIAIVKGFWARSVVEEVTSKYG